MSRKVGAPQPLKLIIESPWQTNVKYIPIEDIEALDADVGSHNQRMTYLQRFPRRDVLLSLLLIFGAWCAFTRYYRPFMEHHALTQSVVDGPVGAYGTHSQPNFADMILVQTLDKSLIPTSGKRKDRNGRLVIVGDVHGMKKELVKLLDKVQFNKDEDHLILTGDMISKGPDSRGVLDLAMDLGATAVRGNHEDRVLLARSRLHSKGTQLDSHDMAEGDSESQQSILLDVDLSSTKGDRKDRLLAKQLSKKHIRWLKQCPVILRVGDIEGMGQVLVVHAGLVPGVNLHAQDPYFVMNMRTIDLKTHVPSESRDGTEWDKLWNYFQARLEPHQRSTVLYGHDSKRGLQIKEYSKGLDSGCLRGGQLTALVIEGGHSGAKQKLVQVSC